MRFSFVLLTLLFCAIAYGVSLLPFTFWQWIEILAGLSLFVSIVLPYFAAWIINFIFRKKERFSLSCDKLSPFGLYVKNLVFQMNIKSFQVSIRVKRIGVRTNFQKALFSVSISSLFVLEVDSLSFGVVIREDKSVAKENRHSAKDSPSPVPKLLKKMNVYESQPLTSQLISDSASPLYKAVRYLVPILRLLDFHVINTIVTVGNPEFPNRIELCISDISLNGNAQYTPTTSLGLNLKLKTVSVVNCENAFDSQPNVVVCNFWLHANMELNRSVIIKEVSLHLGDSFHVRLDKSLHRQLTAIVNSLPAKEKKVREAADPTTPPTPPFEKVKEVMLLLPHSLNVTMPKFEVDLMNADKSDARSHNDVHITMGWIVKCSPMYYDVFCTKPKGVSLTAELTRVQSNWVSCNGVTATLECVLRENQPQLESVKVLYNHKVTTVTLQPSLFRTVEYMQSMMKSINKPKPAHTPRRSALAKPAPRPSFLSLFTECSFVVDSRIESITVDVCASASLPSPQIQLAVQSVVLTFAPSSLRSSSESVSSFHELQFKVASIELQNAPLSRISLQTLLSKTTDVEACPCTDRVVSLCNFEVNCSVARWEKVSAEVSLRSSNLVLEYPMIDMMMFVLTLYGREWREFQARKEASGLKKGVGSSDSLSSMSKPSVAAVPSVSGESGESGESGTPGTRMDAKTEEDQLLQSILDGSLLPDVLTSATSATPQSLTSLPSQDTLSDVSDASDTSTAVHAVDDASSDAEASLEASLEAISDSSDSSDEIPLSELENSLDAVSVEYRCLPLFLSSFTLRLTNAELQVTGCDSLRTVSYSVESLTFALASKAVNSVERLVQGASPTAPSTPVTPAMQVPIPPIPPIPQVPQVREDVGRGVECHPPLSVIPSTGEINSLQSPLSPASPSSAKPAAVPLDTPAELPTDLPAVFTRQQSINFNRIPSFSEPSSLPVRPPQFSFDASARSGLPAPPAHLPTYTTFTPSALYANNACIQYSFSLDITGVSIIGDEDPHTPKECLPLYVPQIRLTFPSLVFLVVPPHQRPIIHSNLSFTVHSTSFSPFSLLHYAGFKRDEDLCLLLLNDNPLLNTVQLVVTHPCTHLAYGTIFTIYHSFLEIFTLVKTSCAALKPANSPSNPSTSPSNSSTSPANPSTSPSNSSTTPSKTSLFSLSRLHFSATITNLSASLVFSPTQGLLVTVSEISTVYPDSASFPLLFLSFVQVSKVAEWKVNSLMGSIESIACYSPGAYKELSALRNFDAVEHDINSLKGDVGPTFKRYVQSNNWGTFSFCDTCKKCASPCCNGYNNQCNASHVPTGVTPFTLIISSIDLFQDRQDAWGDLFYEASVQWKAFKTLRKGDKKPAPFPHPDQTRVEKVCEHAVEEDAYLKGLWALVLVDSVYLRLNDVIPHYSPESCEYSCLSLTGLNGVVSYNPLLHSRAHLLQFMTKMDEVPTPLEKGFDDVIGFHLHDVFVSNVAVDFGELLPPLLVAESVVVCGTMVAAELNRVQRFVVYNDASSYCSSSFDAIPVRISRSSTSLKWYQNLSVQAKHFEVMWGTPLNHVRTSFSNSMGDMTPHGVSKSPKMAFYDKLRFNLHGPTILHVSDSFRVNWITNKCVNNLYEAMVIDLNNTDVLFKREGGVECAFDVFSIGFLRFNTLNQLVLNPFIEAVDGEWVVNLAWMNTRPRDHYVELIEEVTDADKYEFYRSHQIEWAVTLQPQAAKSFNMSIFLRCELAQFLMDFKEYVFATDESMPTDRTAGLMRVSTVFEVMMKMPNSSVWLFVNDESVNGINMLAKEADLSVTMYKLFPAYLEKEGNTRMSSQDKPDYSNLKYDYAIYHDAHWVYPRIYAAIEGLNVDHLSLAQPTVFPPNEPHFTPFCYPDQVSVLLVARTSKISILKGVNPASSGFDEDFADMYSEKIRGVNGRITEKSEGKFAVFAKGAKIVYSLDVRDALMMVFSECRAIYQSVRETQKQSAAKKTPAPEKPAPPAASSPAVVTVALRPTAERMLRPALAHQPSFSRATSDMPYDAYPTASITSSITGPFLARSESSYFSHFNPRDSFRSSINLSLMKGRPELTRTANQSFYRLRGDNNNKGLFNRLTSMRGIQGVTESTTQLRKKRDLFFNEMKKREKEVLNQNDKAVPVLLSYLVKKINHLAAKESEKALVFTEDEVSAKKDESKKDEKEDFLYDIMIKDSQIHVASLETGSSLLLYLYKGTITVQSKCIHSRDYYLLNAAVQKVDLFLGTRKSLNSPWLSSQSLHALNAATPHVGLQPPASRVFKRVIRDFSLSLQTRSQNGFIPSRDIPSFNKDDLVNRITVNIGSFSIQMNGEEFYRFLNVVRYTLLVNPTNSVILRDQDEKRKAGRRISSEIMKGIEAKVKRLVKASNDHDMLPVLKIKYTLEEVQWTLLSMQQEQIAIATLRGFVGEHTFCFDGKSESKIILNDLRIITPSSHPESSWAAPEKVVDPVMVDRDHDAQSNIFEIITVISNSFVCDGIPVSVFEHVGVNVFPGCHYYILFQLTGSMASDIYNYFFPDADAEEAEDASFLPAVEEDSAFDAQSVTALTTRPARPNTQPGALPDIIVEVSDEDSDDASDLPTTPAGTHRRAMSSLQSGDVVSALRKRRNTAQSVDSVSPRSCNHAFEITDRVGVCAICKKKVGSVRNLGYQCQHCSLLVDKNCIAKAFGKVKSRKDSAPRQLVFLEHLRLGTVDIVLSTKGMALLNVKNFSIILQHQIYSDKLTTWGEVIRHVRKAYTSEIIRSAPNILKGWGFRRSGQVDLKEKKKQRLQNESAEEMTDEAKVALLLGIHHSSVC